MPYQACLGTGHQGEQHGEEPSQAPAPWQPLTDDDEGHGDGVGQQIAAHRLLVLAIALPEEADQWVQLVLTQALWAQEDVLALGWAPAPLPCPTAPRPPPAPRVSTLCWVKRGRQNCRQGSRLRRGDSVGNAGALQSLQPEGGCFLHGFAH